MPDITFVIGSRSMKCYNNLWKSLAANPFQRWDLTFDYQSELTMNALHLCTSLSWEFSVYYAKLVPSENYQAAVSVLY